MRNTVKQQFLKIRKIKSYPVLGYFEGVFGRRQLWHVTRHSVARAAAVGIFAAYLPIPFEMIVAVVLAYIWRANLPISVVLIWISNPFTWVLLWGPPYILGAALLGEPDTPMQLMSRDWIEQHYSALFLGCFLAGIAMAVAAYFSVHILWRMDVSKHWKERHNRQQKAKAKYTRG